jgi:hypothetical protein
MRRNNSRYKKSLEPTNKNKNTRELLKKKFYDFESIKSEGSAIIKEKIYIENDFGKLKVRESLDVENGIRKIKILTLRESVDYSSFFEIKLNSNQSNIFKKEKIFFNENGIGSLELNVPINFETDLTIEHKFLSHKNCKYDGYSNIRPHEKITVPKHIKFDLIETELDSSELKFVNPASGKSKE